MDTAFALAALLLPLAAINLTIAWRDWPPEGVGFDSPTLRALYNVLAWGVFSLALIYSVTLHGVIWPVIASAAIWTALWLIRRNVSLRKLYGLALPLSLVGLVCVLFLFQDVFQGSNFGLYSVFPVDR